MQVLFATGNNVKFQHAQKVCQRYGIALEQASLDVPELQAEDSALIARDKAEKGFTLLQQPLVISDDTWVIPGLNGFPGAYMKSMNHWFSVEDWLNLTRPLQDRRIILRQVAVFQDENTQRIFTHDTEGILLTESRGTSLFPHSCITSFDGGKQSDAESHERGKSSLEDLSGVWDMFAEWYRGRN